MHLRVLSDHSLARRLERAEAAANARFVEARAKLSPESGAEWIDVSGTYAMYDGAASPCTQTFGLGLFGKPCPEDLDRLERFFQQRAAPVMHEVSPLADKSLLADLSARRYRPVELTTVLFQPLTARTPEQTGIAVRIAGEEERDVWARTMAEGWRGFIENTDSMLALARVSAARQGATDFLAELDGHPIAAGSLCIHQGVALLAGASTIEAWRGRGAQRALLEGRLAYAADLGCELAMMGAEPGSASQRNAERAGFHIAYTRIKWELAFA